MQSVLEISQYMNVYQSDIAAKGADITVVETTYKYMLRETYGIWLDHEFILPENLRMLSEWD